VCPSTPRRKASPQIASRTMRLTVTFVALCVAACGTGSADSFPTTAPASTTTLVAAPVTTAAPTSTTATSSPATTTTTGVDPHAAPSWLGSQPLPLRPDGFGEVQPTPPELVDRSISTIDLLAPPDGTDFESTISAIPPEVLERSTWSPDCPVGLEQLAYVTVAHWGFDGALHTGELIIHADHASGIVDVFSRLHEERFPIEQMRVIGSDELDLPPTGDGNVTTAFVCRPVVGSTSWSMHASGLAIDINPFHNPYVKGDLVLPELASSYTDRHDVREGMIVEGDAVTDAFAAIGWHWGGRWASLTDPMHFSVNDR
jgi:hypothetical protein